MHLVYCNPNPNSESNFNLNANPYPNPKHNHNPNPKPNSNPNPYRYTLTFTLSLSISLSLTFTLNLTLTLTLTPTVSLTLTLILFIIALICNPDAHLNRYPDSTRCSYFTHDLYGYTNRNPNVVSSRDTLITSPVLHLAPTERHWRPARMTIRHGCGTLQAGNARPPLWCTILIRHVYCHPFHPNTNPNASPNPKPSLNCSRKSDSNPIQTSFDVSHHIATPALL